MTSSVYYLINAHLVNARPMEGSAVVGSRSSHLWACDSRLALYCLREADAHLEQHRARAEMLENSELSLPSPSPPIWEKVEGHFDLISCGCAGLVCGVKNSVIYIRKGTSHDNPVGECWLKCFCDVTAIAVGKRCIVRRTSTGSMFFTCVRELGEASIFHPSWKLIPPGPFEGKPEHFVLDEDDNLYVFTESDDVFCCSGLTDSEEDSEQWMYISKPPPLSSKGALSWVKSFWSEQGGDGFSSVSPGKQCLWCLRGREVWQLVLTHLTTSSGERELRTNWVRFSLPSDAEALCGDPSKPDVFYAMTETNIVMVSLELQQVIPITLDNPIDQSENVFWKSFSVSRTSAPPPAEAPKRPLEAIAITPGLYPKLLRGEDVDVCCENSDCEHCRRAIRSSVVMAVIRNDPEATKPSPLKPFPSGIGSKRRHPSPTEQEVFYTTQEERQVPPVKRRRGKSKLNRHWLLRGVEVYDRHAQMAQQV